MIQFNIPSIAIIAALLIPTSVAANSDECSTQQHNKNTTISVQNGSLTQSFPVCEKGLIKSIRIDATVEFTGNSPVRCEILDEAGNVVAERFLYAGQYTAEDRLTIEDLNIHTAYSTQMSIKVGADADVKVIFDATTTSNSFVGSLLVNGNNENSNISFGVDIVSFDYSSSSDFTGAGGTTAVSTDQIDIHAEGECNYAQTSTTGVIAFEGDTFIQGFKACSRGKLTEIAIATPYVEANKTFNYTVMNEKSVAICDGTFTSDDATNGVLRIPLCDVNTRVGMKFFLRVDCSDNARLACYVSVNSEDLNNTTYINGQVQPVTLTFAAGVHVALANLESADNYGKVTTVEAYPVPFGSVLNIVVNGEIAQGATLELIDTRGNVHYAVSLAANAKGARVKMSDLSMVQGIYAVRVINGRDIVTMQVVKK